MDLDEVVEKPDVGDVDLSTVPRRPTSLSLGEFDAVLPVQVWNQMQAHARTRLDVEVGGVLIGKVVTNEAGGPYLLIEGGIPALAAESRETNITFTAEAWTHIHEIIDREHPGALLVGWYHTHPNFGIFLSDMDVFIQRHFFDLPEHVAIVIDPVAKSHGCFFWRKGVPTIGPLHIEGAIEIDAPAAVTEPRRTVVSKWQARRSVSRIFTARVASIADPFRRLEWSQWAALVTLLALAGVLFGALAMILLDEKPAELGSDIIRWMHGGVAR